MDSSATSNPTKSADVTAGERFYGPCRHGLHVCGMDIEANEFFTVLNIPARNAIEASQMFEVAYSECKCADGEPDDYVVDLCVDWDTDADFPMSRQMLTRLVAVCSPAVKPDQRQVSNVADESEKGT